MKALNELRGLCKAAHINDKEWLSQLIDRKILVISSRLAPIHDSILRVFVAGIMVSDLKLAVTPTEMIMQAALGKQQSRPYEYVS